MNKKQIAYSLLELALVPEDKSIQETLNNSLYTAQLAESLNFRRFWFAEHHNMGNIGSSSPAILSAYIAENTQKIRVGAGGVMLPNHSPLIIAEQFGTLAHLYPGRIDLGLGRAPGTDPQTTQAIRLDFMRAVHEFPQEVTKLQHYFSRDNQNAAVRASIAEGTDVELYILGSSTDSAYLAANKGLPYSFASHFASLHLFEAIKIYKENFQASEFLKKPYTILGINVLVADTDEEAKRLYTTLIQMFLGVLTGDKNRGLQKPSEFTQELQEIAQHPNLQQMLKYSFIGNKQSVKLQLQDFLRFTDADELIIVSSTYYHEDRLKSIQLFSEIMEEINQEKN